MPRRNRVDPWGNLVETPARGAWMGNRGILHDGQGRIVAPWRHKAWITCELQFRGRHREVFGPGRYSELFFLDEATAFAAGHRPCAQCRRARYEEFKSCWCAVVDTTVPASALRAAAMDRRLHAERALRGGRKVVFRLPFAQVPAGAFIEQEGVAWLAWQGRLREWSPYGYRRTMPLPAAGQVATVLTPASVVRLFATGFVPQVHPSAGWDTL